MADNEEAEIGRRGEQVSYGDQKRRLFLIVSTCLLMAALCVALVLKTLVFSNPWIAICAFLLPAIESLLAVLFLNQIRSSQAFLIFAFALSIATIIIAVALKAPVQVLVVICCVNIVWGGLFQLGLDLVTPFQFPQIYCVMAVSFISNLLKLGESVVWAWTWAYAVPVFLTTGMIVLKYYSADAGARDGGGEAVAGGEGEV